MSDKVAEEKEQEDAEVKKKAEEVQKRLWVLQLMYDPELSKTIVVPVQNVKKQGQLDIMLNQAVKQQEMTSLSRVIIELLKNVGALNAPKKGLFKR